MPRGHIPRRWASSSFPRVFGPAVLQHISKSLGHTQCGFLELGPFLGLYRREPNRWRNRLADVISNLSRGLRKNPQTLGKVNRFAHTVGDTKNCRLNAMP